MHLRQTETPHHWRECKKKTREPQTEIFFHSSIPEFNGEALKAHI
jgi:hypothetical protein